MTKFLLQFLALLFAFTCVQTVDAKKIEVNQAKNIALNFLDDKQVSKLYKKAVANDLKLAHTESDDNTPLYYVFNIQSGGFIITSADDRATEILAYVDRGSFEPEALPDNMRWWLGEYARQIKAVCNMPETAVKHTRVPKAAKAEIAPMLETEWSQEAPYNRLCNYDNGTGVSESATGCTATAMAQIMYYHKWPEKGTGSYSYDYTLNVNGKDIPQHKESNFAEHTYDYANMLPSYRAGGYSLAQAEAVALLMYDCAISVNSMFDDISSGTPGASNWVIYSMVDYFGYSPLAKEVYKDQLASEEEWENLIYNDLAAGLPVFYSGETDGGSGHAFVCDGYKDGLYHINWGWEGTFNGYFSVTGADALNPYGGAGLTGEGYRNDQHIITGLKPAKPGSGVAAQDVLTISQSSATHSEELFISGSMMNLSDNEVYMGIELTNVATGKNTITGITDYTFAPGNSFSGLLLSTIDIVTNGTYAVWPVYQISGTSEWLRIEANAGQGEPLMLTITGETPKFYVTEPISFEHGEFTSIENLKLIVKLQALENIENVELRAYFRQPWNGQVAGTLYGVIPSMQKDYTGVLTMVPLGSTSQLQEGMTYTLELYLYENGQDVKIPMSAYTKIGNANIVTAEEEKVLGIDNITVDSPIVDVYTIDGVLIRSKVHEDKAIENLPKGIYVVNGKKILVK